MKDLKIYEFLATIAIGTAISILIVYIFFLTKKLFSKNHFKNEFFLEWLYKILNSDYRKSSHFFIFLLMIFTFGLISQDLTDNLSDSEKSVNPYIESFRSHSKTRVLKTEGELRLQALVNQDDGSLTALGKDIFDDKNITQKLQGQLPRRLFVDTLSISKLWESEGKKILANPNDRKELIIYVNKVYYLSKNWCFLKSEFARNELIEIQLRIDLARSFVIIPVVFSILIIVIYCIYYLIEISKGKRKFKIDKLDPSGKTFSTKKVYNPFAILLIFAITFYLSQICYSVAENNFNERAMGYYVSHFQYFGE